MFPLPVVDSGTEKNCIQKVCIDNFYHINGYQSARQSGITVSQCNQYCLTDAHGQLQGTLLLDKVRNKK